MDREELRLPDWLIHKFKYDDLRIVLDVNSGAVHLVDQAGWDMIGLMEQGLDEGEAARRLGEKYPPSLGGGVREEVARLVRQGLLFSPGYLEGYTQAPEYLVKALCFHVAHDCNMACRYCFARGGTFGGEKGLMPAGVARRGVDFLVENSGPRENCEIDFFGGEPLLNLPVVQETVQYARQRGKEKGKTFKFTLTTNGLLLDAAAREYLDREGFSVILSLDGRREVNDALRVQKDGRGTHDLLLGAFKEFVAGREHRDYYLRGTFTRGNLDFSRDLEYLLSQGFQHISLEPVVAPPGRPYALREEDLPAIYRQYYLVSRLYRERHRGEDPFTFFHFNLDLGRGPCVKKRLAGCGAGTSYLALSPGGDLYPCHQFVGEEAFLMGKVTGGLSFDRPLYHRFLELDVTRKGECRPCWAKFFCGGGCHASAYHLNGDLARPYRLGCQLEKKRLEYALGIQAYLYLGAHGKED